MKRVKLKEISTITFCTYTPSRAKISDVNVKWIQNNAFLENNIIDDNIQINNIVPDEKWKLHKGDIVVKRIMPSYVNYIDEIGEDVYCGNNLIIVSPNKKIDSKYLAFILNENIGFISKKSSIGAVMKSVGREVLENLEIPFLDLEMQKKIGMLWYNGVKIKNKKSKLANLENMAINYNLNKIINKIGE